MNRIISLIAIAGVGVSSLVFAQGPPGSNIGDKMCCQRQILTSCMPENCHQDEQGNWVEITWFDPSFERCEVSPYTSQNCTGDDPEKCADYTIYSDSQCSVVVETGLIKQAQRCVSGADTCE